MKHTRRHNGKFTQPHTFGNLYLLIATLSIGVILRVSYSPVEAVEMVDPCPASGCFRAEAQVENLDAPEPTVQPVEVTTEPKIAKITAYSCGNLTTTEEIMMNCPSILNGKARTSDGTTPLPKKTMACDKANMGRTFEIEGIGQVKCTDTGGAIKGAGRFDLYVETVQEARAWGVKRLEYREIK